MDEIITLLETLKDDKPDFLTKHGAWLLTVIGIASGLVGGIFTYFLKSRCSKIKLGCFSCERQPIELDASQVDVTAAE